MLIELSIFPLGGDTHLSSDIAQVLKIIDDSKIPYQLTPAGTCMEGEWEELMPLIKKCHDQVKNRSSHVITTIKIEDEEKEMNKLTKNVRSVEEKVGKKLSRLPAS